MSEVSFCRFETVKTDISDTCRFDISREVSAVFSFHLSVFRFTKERLNTSKKYSNIIKTHPANPTTCRVRKITICIILGIYRTNQTTEGAPKRITPPTLSFEIYIFFYIKIICTCIFRIIILLIKYA